MPAPRKRKLRFGVMCHGSKLEAAFASALRELLEVDGVELALVIVNAERPQRGSARGTWRLFERVTSTDGISSYAPVDVSDVFAGAPRLECTSVRGGDDGEYLERDAIDAIRSHRLDFILRLASGSPRGEILDVPSYGIWSFHHGDEQRFRGGPAAFWELYEGERAIGATFERLTQGPDAGVVLQKCFASTKLSSYRQTLDAITWASTYMPARVARDVLDGQAPYLDGPPTRTAAPTRRRPTFSQLARFLWRVGRAQVRAQFDTTFLLARWHVGVVREPIDAFLQEGFRPAIQWLPARKNGGFLADPFLAVTGETTRVLMEEFDDRSQEGTIVEVDLESAMRGSPPSRALEGAGHMAYPFVFEHEGTVYCTPETAVRRKVFLYAFDADGERWVERATLLEDAAVVDPTVVRQGPHWWMFGCDDGDNAKLRLWFASDLLGPWRAHPRNPIKADIRSSRPGGTPFVSGGELYRPAQDCAGGYGRAVVINHVTRLTPTEFAEEPVVRYAPPPGSGYRAGTHTLAAWGGLTMIDGKRMALAPGLVVPRTARKLRVLVEKVAR